MPRPAHPFVLSLLLCVCPVVSHATASSVASGPDNLAHKNLTEAETRFIDEMRGWVTDRPIRRRPATLEALRADPSHEMKYASKPAHQAHIDDAAWERFALSLSDTDAANALANTLPEAAAAARLSGDPALLEHVLAQLAELASWAPLQRPGWSGGTPVRSAWLGTAWGVRAIVRTLAEMPPGAVPPSLDAALRARLEDEIAGIREDWRAGRAWYARDGAAYSNQWVLPLEALALASLHNGLERHRDDYEFAIAGLLRSLDAQGSKGEGVEGMQYAAITFDSLLSAAVAARDAGDARLIRHPALTG